MFFISKNAALCLIYLLLLGCGFTNLNSSNPINSFNIIVKTPHDKDNIYFKENLKRIFNVNSSNQANYILITSISFVSTDTLSKNNLNYLKSTKATIEYSLINSNTKNIEKKGSFSSFPSFTSTSSSLYSNNVSLEHLKNRLNLNSAKKLYMQLNMVLKKNT